MKFHKTPFLIVTLGLVAAGTLTAKSSLNKSPNAASTKKSAATRQAPRKAKAKPVARKPQRAQKLASRGALGEGGRDLSGVLYTSPQAILVEKAVRRLTLFEQGVPIKTYLTTIGRNEFAAKAKAGDWATPEGLYRVRRKNPNSKYYLALHIDYPNQVDAERGLSTGLISQSQYNAIVNAIAQEKMPPQNTRLGYYIEIHGRSNRVIEGPDGQPKLSGWTRGCVGMRDDDIREIYQWTPNGTPVLILP